MWINSKHTRTVARSPRNLVGGVTVRLSSPHPASSIDTTKCRVAYSSCTSCAVSRSFDHAIDLHLVAIPVVMELQRRIRPARLSDELLYREGLQQMPEILTTEIPVFRSQIHQHAGESSVHQMRLWTLDETLAPIAGPGGQQAEQKKPLQNLNVVVHRVAVHAQVATERTAIKQRAHPPGYLLFKASANCGVMRRQIEGFTPPPAYWASTGYTDLPPRACQKSGAGGAGLFGGRRRLLRKTR